jgi:hypothetical protein
MAIGRMSLADRFRTIAMTGLGIILSLIPPALWVAWTETMLFAIAAVGILSAVLLVILADSDPHAGKAGHGGTAGMSDEAIAAIHRIFPLTYHHSLKERARFRQAMDKVRRLLR